MKATVQTSDLSAIICLATSTLKAGDPVRIIVERLGEPIDSADFAETDVEPGSIRILAMTDATISEWRRPAEVSRPGSVALEGSALEKFVKASVKSDATLMLETEDVDNHRALRVNTARGSHEFDCLPEEVFSHISIDKSEGEMVDLSNFAKGLEAAAIAAASENESSGSRIALTGVHVLPRDGVIDLVGTDGKRLSLATLRAVDNPAVDLTGIPSGATIPKRLVPLLARVLQSGPSRIRIEDNQITVENRDGAISGRLIDAPYPDYARLLDVATAESIEVDCGLLMTALARSSAALGRDDRLTAAQITRDASGIHLLSRTSQQSSSETISDDGGEEVSIGFDARYAADAIRGLGARRAEIRFSDDRTPIQIRSPERKELTMLVMPMRL